MREFSEDNKVDVIIPVYHPDEKLEKLIEKLNEQTVRPAHVYFMQTKADAQEDKRVRDLLERCENAVITEIEKKEFDHGGTRNRGALLSDAAYMLFMTQDAVPVGAHFIERLVQAMENPGVGVAYGRQLPNAEAGAVECYTREFNYPRESRLKSKEDLEELGIKTYFCSNVCALYRKNVYEQMGGFVLHTIFNEDMIMASKIIQAGYKIAYVAEAEVIHSHKYTYRQQFSRNFDMAVSQQQYKEIFDGIKSESEGIRLVKSTAKYLLSKGKWYLIPDLILQSGFKYLGYRKGRNYEKLPEKKILKYSMNKAYWKAGTAQKRCGNEEDNE